jgi:pyruvate-ferredoxin/flavodoxin oxidoreductase
MSYENVYVAQVSLGGNMQQTINALKEAEEHDGPSLVIAYAPCITHGIKSGMKDSINEEKLAVQSGYFPIFRYNPVNDELKLDYKNPDFDKYDELLENENRYIMLKAVNKEKAEELLNINKENAKKKFEYLKKMSNNE